MRSRAGGTSARRRGGATQEQELAAKFAAAEAERQKSWPRLLPSAKPRNRGKRRANAPNRKGGTGSPTARGGLRARGNRAGEGDSEPTRKGSAAARGARFLRDQSKQADAQGEGEHAGWPGRTPIASLQADPIARRPSKCKSRNSSSRPPKPRRRLTQTEAKKAADARKAVDERSRSEEGRFGDAGLAEPSRVGGPRYGGTRSRSSRGYGPEVRAGWAATAAAAARTWNSSEMRRQRRQIRPVRQASFRSEGRAPSSVPARRVEGPARAGLPPSKCSPREVEANGRCVAKTCGPGEILARNGACVARPAAPRVAAAREAARSAA